MPTKGIADVFLWACFSSQKKDCQKNSHKQLITMNRPKKGNYSTGAADNYDDGSGEFKKNLLFTKTKKAHARSARKKRLTQ